MNFKGIALHFEKVILQPADCENDTENRKPGRFHLESGMINSQVFRQADKKDK